MSEHWKGDRYWSAECNVADINEVPVAGELCWLQNDYGVKVADIRDVPVAGE